MPKASTKTSGSKAANNRIEPYSKSSPKIKDKENVDPKTQDSTKPDHDRGDYRDISLDEIKGEVPCYDDAATVRRKLKKLLTDKSIIPGTSKKWTQAAMVAEMQELEKRGHPVPYNQNATGPSARSLGNFLKKTGKMGAGDSPCYYWGYILSEKLRIWNGDKKSKPRLKAEEEFPGGHVREDASTKRMSMPRGGPPPPGAWEPNARGVTPAVPSMPLGPQGLCTGSVVPLMPRGPEVCTGFVPPVPDTSLARL
ncbi:MAG: hypothetical protein HETSPECPRED_006296 [Heterodermia speciosa]|uniref:Uncharacterized protein n=1 Tax=Heterodermia speciosa TaxID=116794 RepID=A0A8H3FJJ3_9LECA|nr:MAG: hypothetical protein HETSPECPRED_006296 [Heterodermia speciosa]